MTLLLETRDKVYILEKLPIHPPIIAFNSVLCVCLPITFVPGDYNTLFRNLPRCSVLQIVALGPLSLLLLRQSSIVRDDKGYVARSSTRTCSTMFPCCTRAGLQATVCILPLLRNFRGKRRHVDFGITDRLSQQKGPQTREDPTPLANRRQAKER